MNPALADPLKARLLLTFGGPLGLHRLYLNQVSEAFIYLSTSGILFIGVLYDVFIIHALVKRYNDTNENEKENIDENLKYKNGKLLPTVSKHVNFSLEAFILSTLYGMWLGILCWIAASIVLRVPFNESVLAQAVVSMAVSSGIYIFGNRSNQTRNLLYIWISTFSSAFLSKFITGSNVRTVFISSLVGTLIGNRSAKIRLSTEKALNVRHFIFWSSLFFLLLCIIATSSTRHILEQKVSVSQPGGSTVISSVGSLIHDRFFNVSRVHKFFRNHPRIEYKKTSNPRKKYEWWDFDFFAQTPVWADYIKVFIVDILRSETKVNELSLEVEPLRWACWRLFLINHFDVSPLIPDASLKKLCLEREYTARENRNEDDYLEKSIKLACDIFET